MRATLGFKNIISNSKALETIARMSCNPGDGGNSKGQIIREIDALGGLSGVVTDESSIQFRMLNRSKGPNVGPRNQWTERCLNKNGENISSLIQK